jgi:katanin p60 ATPase-containing subunit A1
MFLAVMTVMAVSINEICENTKLAREMALMGNYETAGVYYQGVVQQIHKLLISIADPTRKGKWQLVSNFHKVIHYQYLLSCRDCLLLHLA